MFAVSRWSPQPAFRRQNRPPWGSTVQRGLTITLRDEAATRIAGNDIAVILTAPCIIHLAGDLGAGKTSLARSIIRCLVGEKDAEVPSPTFSLVQHYQGMARGAEVEVLHADLYRISEPEEIYELGFGEPSEDQILLIEWPERAADELPPADLTLQLDTVDISDGSEGRSLTIYAEEELLEGVRRSFAIREFLNFAWNESVERRFLLGDASIRSYETAVSGDQTRILMNAPRQADGPPIRDGKPYSQIAHLAEDVSAFVGVAKILARSDLVVPEIYGSDLEAGLLLISDLGSEGIVDADHKPIEERYLAGAEMLAHLHETPIVNQVSIERDRLHKVPEYDRPAMMIEVELLTDWYLPSVAGSPLTTEQKTAFERHWHDLITRLEIAEKHLVLRDFHSPNILWQSHESGHRRIGVIDFQDAMIGPCAYDVASLAQDARVDVSEDLEARVVNAYIKARAKTGSFDEDSFRQAYAIVAAQRATKIMGIFVRLNERDGKPAYLAHLPRMEAYLARSLAHPALHTYRDWLRENSVLDSPKESDAGGESAVTNQTCEHASSASTKGD